MMGIFNGPTLEQRFVAANRRPAGFDYLRIGLAIMVLLSHTINVSYGMEYTLAVWEGPARPLFAFRLPMFFALSGFLVARSLERCDTLISFLGLRVMRIVPALAVEVLLSALIFGPVFTTLSLGSYFADPHFYTYFLNILGYVHMELPGVFWANPWVTNVNEQLWTLPWELKCYVLLAAMFVLRIVKSKIILVLAVVGLHALLLVLYFIAIKGQSNQSPVTVSGWVLVLAFLVGVTMYVFREKIVHNRTLFFVSVAATFVFLSIPNGDYFTTIPAAYATVYLGLLNPKRIKLITTGDYSYGIFLYGFLIQQAIAALGPWTWHWYISLLLALPLTAAMAAGSWWFVEKPASRLKPWIINMENRIVLLVKSLPLVFKKQISSEN